MARTSFTAPEARIVVSSDGYFDVYPSTARTTATSPPIAASWPSSAQGSAAPMTGWPSAPDSVALADAVTAWAAVNGASALSGELGGGRDGSEAAA